VNFNESETLYCKRYHADNEHPRSGWPLEAKWQVRTVHRADMLAQAMLALRPHTRNTSCGWLSWSD
jgi:hypothetical protein